MSELLPGEQRWVRKGLAPCRGPLRAGAPRLLEPSSALQVQMPDSEAFKSQPPPHRREGGGWLAWRPSLHSRDEETGPAPSHPRPAAEGSRSAFQRRRQHGVSGTRLPAISPRALQLGPRARVHTPMATPMAFIKLRGTVGFSQSLLSTLTGKKMLEKNLRPRRRSEIKVDHKTQGKR